MPLINRKNIFSHENWRNDAIQYWNGASTLAVAHERSLHYLDRHIIDEKNPEYIENYRALHISLPILVCMAYSFECIFKAILVLTNHDNVKNNLQLPKMDVFGQPLEPTKPSKRPKFMKGNRGHDLPYLCEICGIEISEEEKELLDGLKDITNWGRYPPDVDKLGKLNSTKIEELLALKNIIRILAYKFQ